MPSLPAGDALPMESPRGLLQVFISESSEEACSKRNAPALCRFWYRSEIPRAAVLQKQKNKNKALLNYLDYSQHFLEIWLRNTILELIQKCLGVLGCVGAWFFL